jgi:DNA repair exonuclease SbcCD ATPase subunit
VCDFDVEIGINDKNDVMFYVVKDGLVDELNGGSGFELTAASLALRFVLGSVSTIPRLNYVTLDEVWGRVEVANFENIKALLEKMLKDYDFLLLVSHQEEIKNWCEKSLVAEKNNNISTIRIASQREK